MTPRKEIERLRRMLADVNKHFSCGWNGMFSPNWKEEAAEAGYWLHQEDADAIRAILSGSTDGVSEDGK